MRNISVALKRKPKAELGRMEVRGKIPWIEEATEGDIPWP